MPQDRLLHPRAGHSRKVNTLSDFEFRVWWTYQMAADDFGVMRRDAVVLQAANDSLAQRSRAVVNRAFDRVIELGLVVPFEHQDESYVCQLDWQDFQKVRYPRESHLPIPGAALLLRCSPSTRALFKNHSGCVSEKLPKDSRASQSDDAKSSRLTANGIRLTANGLGMRFDEFWQHYPRKVGKDAARRAWDRCKPSAELLLQILAVLEWQRKTEAWTKDGGQFIPHPATWLNQGRWEDEPVQVEKPSRASTADADVARVKELLGEKP